MKKQIFLISLLMLFMSSCFEDCNNPNAPDVPEPEPVEYHDYYIEYRIRPEWIVNPKHFNAELEIGIIENHQPTGRIILKRVNDYLFRGEFNGVRCQKSLDNRTFDWRTYDRRRVPVDLPSEETPVFGNIFILEDKETGIRTELTNIINNIYPRQSPAPGTMVRCWIFSDGTVSNTPPNSN